jgi:RHS repeat-associated protein
MDDSIGRLTSDAKMGEITNTYTFDGNGNRKTYNSTNSTFDNQDKLLTQGSITYTWDALGNRSGKSDGTVYVHDGMGALKSWTKTGNTVSYEQDGLQRRVSRSKNGTVTARYVYDGQYRIVAETVSQSRFIYATQSHSPDLISRNNITYKVVKNHLGSVRHIVNVANGQIIQSIDYDAWGNVVSDSNPGFQPFGFAGGLWDADVNLIHFGFRDYDPNSGTWTSRDPIRLQGGLNVYAYGGNVPVRNFDPSGLYFSSSSNAVWEALSRLARNRQVGWAIEQMARDPSTEFQINEIPYGNCGESPSRTNLPYERDAAGNETIAIDFNLQSANANLVNNFPGRATELWDYDSLVAHELGHAFHFAYGALDGDYMAIEMENAVRQQSPMRKDHAQGGQCRNQCGK